MRQVGAGPQFMLEKPRCRPSQPSLMKSSPFVVRRRRGYLRVRRNDRRICCGYGRRRWVGGRSMVARIGLLRSCWFPYRGRGAGGVRAVAQDFPVIVLDEFSSFVRVAADRLDVVKEAGERLAPRPRSTCDHRRADQQEQAQDGSVGVGTKGAPPAHHELPRTICHGPASRRVIGRVDSSRYSPRSIAPIVGSAISFSKRLSAIRRCPSILGWGSPRSGLGCGRNHSSISLTPS